MIFAKSTYHIPQALNKYPFLSSSVNTDFVSFQLIKWSAVMAYASFFVLQRYLEQRQGILSWAVTLSQYAIKTGILTCKSFWMNHDVLLVSEDGTVFKEEHIDQHPQSSHHIIAMTHSGNVSCTISIPETGLILVRGRLRWERPQSHY